MLKNRKFLFGLGTGMMIGAILVQLSAIGSAASTAPGATPTPSSSSSLFADSPTVRPTAQPSPSTGGLSLEELAAAAKQQGKVLLSAADYARLQQAASASATPSTTAAASAKRYLYIYKGMDSDSVEEYLYQAGIIRDRLAFRDRLKEKGLTHKIVANLYGFEPDSDIDTVVAALTGTK
jgi:hypothetical protein